MDPQTDPFTERLLDLAEMALFLAFIAFIVYMILR